MSKHQVVPESIGLIEKQEGDGKGGCDNFVKNISSEEEDEAHEEVNLWLKKTKQHYNQMGTIPEENSTWSKHQGECFPEISICEIPIPDQQFGVRREEDCVWTEDNNSIYNIRQNQMVYMDAGAKIDKISQSLDMIENDFEISKSSQFLVTSLRGLTKELQGILTERTRKINYLEAQCEKQQSLMNSHRNENEYVLEKIDHAMKELENTIMEQYKKIDQLDKNSVAQQMLVDNYKKERLQNLSKIENLEQSLLMAAGEKKKVTEKLSLMESREQSNKESKEALMERILHLQMEVERQKGDKELLLERIVNLEVELDELMKEEKEEKDLLLERINHLELTLNSNNQISDGSLNNQQLQKLCMLSHDTKQEVLVVPKDAMIQENKDKKVKRGSGVDVVDKGKYASKGVAINVIHNMLHKDKLAKLI